MAEGTGRRARRLLGDLAPAAPRLEWRIARRYLRSRRSSSVASLNTVISTGGVAVGVMALIVVLGVMNGLRNDLRERILVANPHLRVLTFGAGLRMDDWRRVLQIVRKEPGVVAAAPEVISQAGITAGQDYGEGVNLVGFDADTGSPLGHLAARSRSARATSRSAPPSPTSTAASSWAPGWPTGSRSTRATWSRWSR